MFGSQPFQGIEHVAVSENGGTPKPSILIGFPLFSPSILGYHYFGNTHVNPKSEEWPLYAWPFFWSIFG